MRVTPFADPAERFRAGLLGMRIFLISLGMLFAATLLGYVVIRLQFGSRWPDLPPLPALLWLSTFVLVISSATMQWAVFSAQKGSPARLRMAMTLTTALGITFLLLQAECWLQWMGPMIEHWANSDAYRLALTAFYVLTGLHAAHVIGGLLPMFVVTARSMRVDSSQLRQGALPGVHYLALYWHFLDAVWLVLFVAIKLCT